MRVKAFFLVPGVVTIDIPDHIDISDKKKLRETADDRLADISNKDLLEALALSEDYLPLEDLIFQDKPYIEALELQNLTPIFQTKVWTAYKKLDEIDYEK